MIVELKREYRFEAAHRLPHVPTGHKCARVHGHSYKVELHVTGAVNPATGWLVDFAEIDDLWAPINHRLDHHYLNDVPGLENSTCEVLAGYIWRELRPRLPQLTAVTIWETTDASCTFRGEGD